MTLLTAVCVTPYSPASAACCMVSFALAPNEML